MPTPLALGLAAAVHKTGYLHSPFLAFPLGGQHQVQEYVGLTMLPDLLLKRCIVTALLPSGSASTLLVFLALCASVLADTFGSFLGGLGRRTGSMLRPQAPYQLAPPIGWGYTDLTRNRLEQSCPAKYSAQSYRRQQDSGSPSNWIGMLCAVGCQVQVGLDVNQRALILTRQNLRPGSAQGPEL